MFHFCTRDIKSFITVTEIIEELNKKSPMVQNYTRDINEDITITICVYIQAIDKFSMIHYNFTVDIFTSHFVFC